MKKNTLHLSHKEGSNSSEVKFLCNFLYIALMDLSTCNNKKVIFRDVQETKEQESMDLLQVSNLPQINWISTSSWGPSLTIQAEKESANFFF